jgi:hypothetical protein
MEKISKALILILVFMLVSITHAKYGGGTGEPNDPYRIANFDDLMALAVDSSDWNRSFILTSDIYIASKIVFDKAVISPDNIPYNNDFDGIAFTGVFDGNNCKIMNLNINGYDYAGFFGQIGANAQITNLRIENCSITGHNYIGTLVGYNSQGTITNCSASCDIIGPANNDIGGLVGFNNGEISNCFATGSITCEYLPPGTRLGSTGGLVGKNFNNITKCYADVEVQSAGFYVGGLAGSTSGGSINTCYAIGSVIGDSYVGGLVGFGTNVSNCYATGNINGELYVGGLVGFAGGRITSSYSIGHVSGGLHVGGLIGCRRSSDIIVITSFWDQQTSGTTYSDGGRPKITEEMQTLSTFTNAKWDFIYEIKNGTEDIWFLREGLDYPQFCYAYRPVANAGENLQICADVNGYATIELDGSASSDPDGDQLDYLWFWRIDWQMYHSFNEKLVLNLPVGEYHFTLSVDDGLLQSQPDYVTVTVLPTFEFPMHLTPKVLNAGSQGNWVKAHFELPSDYAPEDIDPNTPLIIEPFDVESKYINVFINDDGFVEIEAGFDRSELGKLGDFGPDEVRVIGRLADSSCFVGIDTVKIIDHRIDQLVLTTTYWLNEQCDTLNSCDNCDLNADGIIDFVDYAAIDNLFVEFTVQ